MIAEGIIKKIQTNRNIKLTRIEAGYLLNLLHKVIGAQKSNEKYYRVNESMTRRRDRWTASDIKYLVEAYERGDTDVQIARHLERSVKGVERKRHVMGLRKERH